MFEHVEQLLGFQPVPGIGIDSGLGDQAPAVLPIEGLAPPAIQDADVQRPVEPGFLTRGATRLHGVFRIVEPDIHAGDQFAPQRQVVVFDEEQLAFELGLFRIVADDADQILAGPILGVCLAGEEQHDGAIGLVQDACKPDRIAEHQRCTLVGRETAGEAQDQRRMTVGRQMRQQTLDVGFTHVIAPILAAQHFARIVQQAGLDVLAQTPEGLIGDGLDVIGPEPAVGHVFTPAPRAGIEQHHPFTGQEGHYMHPIGDIANGIFRRRNLRPVVGFHAGSDLAVDPAHPIVET